MCLSLRIPVEVDTPMQILAAARTVTLVEILVWIAGIVIDLLLPSACSILALSIVGRSRQPLFYSI